MAYGLSYGEFAPYVSVAERRRRAASKLARLRKEGHEPSPVAIAGRTIATTFWGKAWCGHLESYADFGNRLPRGRTYLRNGSVIDLRILKGEVRALVSGSAIYEATVRVVPLPAARWARVRQECSGRIGSVVELLAGKLSGGVMEVLCHREKGLFPSGREISMTCSCPDGVWLCKHLAAVLYGVGARLDHAPDLLFTLRGVDGAELVADAGRADGLAAASNARGALGDEHLADIFGIDIEARTPPPRAKAKAKAQAQVQAKVRRPRRERTTKGIGKGVAKGIEEKRRPASTPRRVP